MSELIKWLMRQDDLGLPGAPLQDAAKCPSPPPGHRDIYKVLKFGVSLQGGGALPPASRVLFYFLKSLLGLPSSLLGAYAPAPAPPLLMPGQGEGGARCL